MTADRATLLALAEEVEKLTGPSRDIDLRILCIIAPKVQTFVQEHASLPCRSLAKGYTASLDAAADLMPPRWRNASIREEPGEVGGWSVTAFRPPPQNALTDGRAHTEVLARTACALRARAAEMEGENAEAV
jgi:hypothetical protein